MGGLTVAVYGATGGTGRRLLPLLLAAGHRVRALVRTPSKLGGLEGAEGLEVVQGDATDSAAVANVAKGADVLVSCLGGVPRGPLVVSQAFRAILDVAGRQGAKCLFLTTVGVGGTSFIVKVLLSIFVGFKMIADYEKADEMVRQHTASPWVLVRPNSLTDGDGGGGAAAYPPEGGWRTAVARQDVAQFLCEAVTSSAWDNKAVSLCGKS